MKVWLNPIEPARNMGFRTHEISGILMVVRERQAAFLEAWHEHFGESDR